MKLDIDKEAKEFVSFTQEEALKETTEYFGGDKLAARVWVNKYALRNLQGELLEKNPEQMHHRLAEELSRIEKKYPNPLSKKEIFNLINHFRYVIPSGGPMTGIGNKWHLATLSNCYVVGQEGSSDSYGAIMKTDEELVQLIKRRGGVGIDLSGIRPKGLPVRNAAIESSGIVPFMERFSHSTLEVAQKGRRGALMLSVSVKHPDVLDFVNAKTKPDNVTGANISVKVDDEFMQAIEDNEVYKLQWPVDAKNPEVATEIEAHTLWRSIVNNAWSSAEPGLLFWDTIKRESITDCYANEGFTSVSTNPCGEIPLCAYDSCRLMSINLYSYVRNPFQDNATFNYPLFRDHVKKAQRLLDDIVDLELEKIDEILHKIEQDPQDQIVKRTEKELWIKVRERCQLGRRTGLGITAEGDMLAALGHCYGSDKAIKQVVKIHKEMALSAYESSIELAKQRGAFPIFSAKKEKNNPFLLRIKEANPTLYQTMQKVGRRNIACLTIAPTGSISLLTQTTSGIEPVFKVVYKRRRQIDENEIDSQIDYVDNNGDIYEEYIIFHQKFKEWMLAKGINSNKKFSDEELAELVRTSPYNNSTVETLDYLNKVRMQGAIQQWVDHSISATVNLPEDASEEMVESIYLEAWRCGCKGCTIYREGSRTGIMLDANKSNNNSYAALQQTITEIRPTVLECDVVRFQNNKEKWVAFVGLLDGYPYEIFTGLQDDEEGIVLPKSVLKGRIIKHNNRDGSKRYDFQFENKRGYKTTVEGLSEKFNKEYWNYAKLISGVLRYRMPLDRVIKLVSQLSLGDENINTWKTGVERALKKYIKDGTKASGICPNCGQESLVYQEGCPTCKNCGASQCG